MDQGPDVIRERIEEQRQELVENVRELETRVRSMADWRTHFQRDPVKMLGVSFAAGLALSLLTRGGNDGVRNCNCYCD